MKNQKSNETDLHHFLRLAAAQIRHQINKMEANQSYSERIARLRMLEEFIKEQVPDENPGHSTRSAR